MKKSMRAQQHMNSWCVCSYKYSGVNFGSFILSICLGSASTIALSAYSTAHQILRKTMLC